MDMNNTNFFIGQDYFYFSILYIKYVDGKIKLFSLLNTKNSLHYELLIGVYEILQLFFKYGIVNGIIIFARK